MSNIQTALLLMVVGMVTVFIILLIVIGLGKALIAFVNKFVPEEEAPAQSSSKLIASRIPPAAILAIRNAPSSVNAIPSCLAMCCILSIKTGVVMRRKSYR